MRDRLAAVEWSWLVPRGIQFSAPFIGIGIFFLLEDGTAGSYIGGTEEFGIWQLLIVGQVIAWALLAGAGLRTLIDMWDRLATWRLRPERPVRDVAPYLAFGYGTVILLLILYQAARAPAAPGGDLAGYWWKIVLLTAMGIAATLPYTILLRVAQLATAESGTWGSIADDVPRMRYLRSSSLAATAALAFIIAMAVLATGAMRQAIAAGRDRAIAAIGGPQADDLGLLPFPEIYVILYGVLFSALIGAIYLHVFNEFDARGQSTLDDASPISDPMSAADFSTVHKARAELASELQIGGDIRKNLEGFLVVISPLLSALLSRLAGISV
jgi:hypothetical protein